MGGVISPLLANVLLDEVDKELEKRGHAFARYADDSNVYVRSERAGKRVMDALKPEFRLVFGTYSLSNFLSIAFKITSCFLLSVTTRDILKMPLESRR